MRFGRLCRSGAVLAAALLLWPAAAAAQDKDNKDKKEEEKPKQTPLVPKKETVTPDFNISIWDGLTYRDPKWKLSSHVGGIFAADYVAYDGDNRRHPGARLDRTVFVWDVKSENEDLPWKIRLETDTTGIETRFGLDEGWFAFDFAPGVRVTGGLLEFPCTIEGSIPEEILPFTNYAFPMYISHRTDVGAMIEVEMDEGLLYYQIAIAGGEGFDRFGQEREEPQGSVWAVTYPFRPEGMGPLFGNGEIPILSGTFLSFAMAYTRSYDGQLDIANPADSKLFNTPRMKADWSGRGHAGIGCDAGPARAMFDMVRGTLYDLNVSPTQKVKLRHQITAWQAQGSVFLFGGSYDSRPFRRNDGRPQPFPTVPLYPNEEQFGIGAAEIGVRYSNADIDRRLFQYGFTSYDRSSQEFRSLSAVLNYYPNKSLRATIEYVHTIADDDPAEFGGQGRDSTWIFRIQYMF